MRIDFLGHAAFSFTTGDGVCVLVDPYESGGFGGRVGYAPIDVAPDLVLITHDHLDHSHTASLAGTFSVIRHAGSACGVDVRSVPAFHDMVGGTRFGGTVDMKVFTIDGLRICHAGDLGQLLTDAQVAAIGALDVFIPPVGGYYTLDADGAYAVTRQLRPRVVIPCHYKTARCGFDLAPVEPFASRFERLVRPGGSTLDLDATQLPKAITCVVLEPRL